MNMRHEHDSLFLAFSGLVMFETNAGIQLHLLQDEIKRCRMRMTYWKVYDTWTKVEHEAHTVAKQFAKP